MFPKSVPTFFKRDTRAKSRGAELMALSVKNAGKPGDNSKPVPMQDFVQRKLKESTQHGEKPATDARKIREHFAPRQGR
jgi:hypothetical protein